MVTAMAGWGEEPMGRAGPGASCERVVVAADYADCEMLAMVASVTGRPAWESGVIRAQRACNRWRRCVLSPLCDMLLAWRSYIRVDFS